MTYSSCTGGKFRPEAESASSSLSSCPDWPGLGLELREAIWRFFFVIFFCCFFRLHSKMGFWTSLDYIIGAVCFELRGLVHSLWKLTGCFKIGFYPMGGTYFGCFHKYLHPSITVHRIKVQTFDLDCRTLTKFYRISFLPFFRTIQNGGELVTWPHSLAGRAGLRHLWKQNTVLYYRYETEIPDLFEPVNYFLFLCLCLKFEFNSFRKTVKDQKDYTY